MPVYFNKRNDTFYFSRSIPSDLQHRFKKQKIELSLRTKSESKTAKSAAALSDRLERYWNSLRMEMIYSRELGLSIVPEAKRQSLNDLSLTDALSLYHRLKGAGKTKLFFEASDRSIRYLTEHLGHDNLSMLEVSDAGQFGDFLFERGISSSSLKPVFSSVRAIINLAIKKQGIAVSNVFISTYIPDDELKQKRSPIQMDILRQVQSSCRSLNEESRWLIAFISDTGMRLSEACELLVSDIHLDTNTPYIDLAEHPWRRSKTGPSKRQVRLVGFSLWAAKQIFHAGSDFALPEYCGTTKFKADSASAALNKWLTPRVPETCVIHSFRHGFHDRLRTVKYPADIIDAIGGWFADGVGQCYRVGFYL